MQKRKNFDKDFTHTFINSIDCNSCNAGVTGEDSCENWFRSGKCPGKQYFKIADGVSDKAWREDHSSFCPCRA